LSVSLVAVVEDDPRVLGSLESLLASAGYDVLLFSSAEAFLSSDRLYAVDCLISDIGLPGMNGIDLLRELRSRGIAVRSFFITGRKEDSVLRAGLAAGALRTFLKPFDVAEILNSIAAL
jgi:FixJ family two-component response regulator